MKDEATRQQSLQKPLGFISTGVELGIPLVTGGVANLIAARWCKPVSLHRGVRVQGMDHAWSDAHSPAGGKLPCQRLRLGGAASVVLDQH